MIFMSQIGFVKRTNNQRYEPQIRTVATTTRSIVGIGSQKTEQKQSNWTDDDADKVSKKVMKEVWDNPSDDEWGKSSTT